MTPPALARRVVRVGAVGALLLAAGCSASDYSRAADRSANRILERRVEDTVGRRPEKVVYPDARPEEPEGGESEAGGAARPPGLQSGEEPTRVLDLTSALGIAYQSNRTLIAQKEQLFLTALSLFEVRHSFSPLLASSLSYLFADGAGVPEAHAATWAGSLSKILATGATVRVDAAANYDFTNDSSLANQGLFSNSLSVSLVQPLLRGAGYEVSHEALTQAERNLVYAIRDFELFREDFSIDVARRFYDLVQQQQSIENERRNFEELLFGERQAQALFDVGRSAELDVLRARRNRLNAENRLIEAQESYREALARFRIFLGLPDDERVDVTGDSPVFVPVTYEVTSAVDVALANRLDYLTRREQLEDAERGVRLARNDLLPSLDLNTSVTVPSTSDPSFGDVNRLEESATVGLTLELPVDRVNQRGSYRRAQIALVQARRNLDEFRDNLVVDVESAFRELDRRQQSLAIQRQLIEDERKNVRIAQLRFERGELSNRDVVEAQQGLLDARNSLIREQVNYEISRLRLRRDLGILFIDDRGMWNE